MFLFRKNILQLYFGYVRTPILGMWYDKLDLDLIEVGSKIRATMLGSPYRDSRLCYCSSTKS